MDEIKNEQSAAAEAPVETPQPEEKPVETPVEESKPEVEDPKPEETEQKVDEDPKPVEDPKPAENKPDFTQLTKEQKAEHAFQKQLAKQKAKYESSVEEMKKSFQSQLDEIKKAMAPKKEEPMKQREDFDNDTDFVDYLTMRGVDKRLAERDEQEAKARAEREESEKAQREEAERQQELANYFNANAKNAFGEQFGEFEKLVQKSVANGLADVLDEAPSVRDYIFSNPNGPIVLNEMLRNRDSFVRIMSRGASPMEAVIECHDLAREIASRVPEPEQPKPTMPNLGKPGAGSAPRTAPDMWNDDSSLIDYVRRHR